MKSCSLVQRHVLWGVFGVVTLTVALFLLRAHSLWAAIPLILTIVAWRGCPGCWMMGLVRRLEESRKQKPLPNDTPQ